jgi:hypothetical protein
VLRRALSKDGIDIVDKLAVLIICNFRLVHQNASTVTTFEMLPCANTASWSLGPIVKLPAGMNAISNGSGSKKFFFRNPVSSPLSEDLQPPKRSKLSELE